ncbi:MAG: hypothetical protein LBL00_05990 [Endomicrobium sp.]|jgi:hypothetical protein|nr:hypothetical protein [Endomicrobium sp.]
MIQIKKLEFADTFLIERQAQQDENVNANIIKFCINNGDGVAIAKDGKILACVWWHCAWANMLSVSALISASAGKDMFALVKVLKKMVSARKEDRLECIVKNSFKNAHKLMRILGFTVEGIMRKYIDGKNYALYAKVSDDNDEDFMNF